MLEVVALVAVVGYKILQTGPLLHGVLFRTAISGVKDLPKLSVTFFAGTVIIFFGMTFFVVAIGFSCNPLFCFVTTFSTSDNLKELMEFALLAPEKVG